jgi:precorrin-3B synthase
MSALALPISPTRGACPGLSTPMPTGDGLLVRLLSTGTISLAAFGALCRAARHHGNGIVEITARGSIQVRGLTAASAPRFANDVAALGIATADGVPVLTNALAGLDAEEILDANALAEDLRSMLSRTDLAAKLAPKVSVAIDGSGAVTLDDIAADVRLHAEMTQAGAMLRLGVGGDVASAIQFGVVPPARAVDAVVRLLEVVAAHGLSARARAIVDAEGAKEFQLAIGGLLISDGPREGGDPEADSRLRRNERTMLSPVGLFLLRGGSYACGVGLAFGHTEASTLERLLEAAAKAGAHGVRAAVGRALIALGLAHDSAAGFAADAERLGFIVSADDPRRYVLACAGAPICASAHIAARAMAPAIAEMVAPFIGGAVTIHVSGCAKGCAHTSPAALTIVGTPEGYALVTHGTARDAPHLIVAEHELPGAIARRESQLKHGVGYV